MSIISSGRRLLVYTILCLAGLAWYLASPARMSFAAQEANFDLTKAKFYGVGACKACHIEGSNFKRDFVKLTEYTTWKNEDKHSLAYASLESPRGQRIGELLSTKDRPFRVTKEAACLNCHSMNFPGREGEAFSFKDGVSCDGCHGPADYWLKPHAFDTKMWRALSPEDKQAKYGMFNVRDPIKRAEMCLSCHVGSPGEGKVVTHSMYAAGHPPLTSFEVASFSRNLPQHWWDVKDVPILKSAGADLQKTYHFNTGDAAQTKLVLAGGAAALHTAMRFIADRASADARNAEPAKKAGTFWPPVWLQSSMRDAPSWRWPELLTTQAGAGSDYRSLWPELAMTHSDCYACHHDLKLPSWRQIRGYQGKPGRPPLRPWPLALVELMALSGNQPQLSSSKSISDFQKCQSALAQALSDQPFGNPDELVPAVTNLEAWAHGLLEKLNTDFGALKDTRTMQVGLLRALSDLPPTYYPDYDSARQIAWAFQSVFVEWKKIDPNPARAKAIGAILDKWEGQLNLKPDSQRAKRSMLVRAMLPRDGFGADAAQWQSSKWRDISGKERTGKQGFLEALQNIEDEELDKALQHVSSYDPVAFKNDCRELRKLVPEQ